MIEPISVDADLASIRAAGPWLRSFLTARADVPIDLVAKVELAVQEIAANVVQHGGGSTIGLTATIEPHELVVEVIDDGTPFVLDAPPEPEDPQVRGYGLMIVRRLTTDLTREHRNGRNHTRLHFGRRDRTVLIVDDDTASRVVLRFLLERAGLEVIEAIDGGEALARLDETPVGLVISDHEMPGMSGLELRRRLGDGLRAPFVLLTGYANPGEFDPDDLAGVDAFLTKPVSSDAIRKLLG